MPGKAAQSLPQVLFYQDSFFDKDIWFSWLYPGQSCNSHSYGYAPQVLFLDPQRSHHQCIQKDDPAGHGNDHESVQSFLFTILSLKYFESISRNCNLARKSLVFTVISVMPKDDAVSLMERSSRSLKIKTNRYFSGRL